MRHIGIDTTTPRRASLALVALVAAACAGGPAPEPASRPAPQQTPQRQRPPAAMPLEAVAFPDFTTATLDNGAKVIIVQNHEQPVASVNLVVKTGSASDPSGLTGVADFTASMLDKGTKTRDAKEIAEAIDFIGANVNASASDDWTSINATALTEFLDRGLALMADVVMNPTFPADELETMRKRELTSLQLAKSQPTSLASREFTRFVYGGHPYGRVESEQDVRAIGRDDLVRFHHQNYTPGNALFVVAGDVNPTDIVARLNRAFAGWSGGAPMVAGRAAAPQPTQTELHFIHKPGSVQAVIRVGHLMPAATEADWPAIDVVTQILGGGVTGWMFQVLREQKGYTYGAYAGASEKPGPGTFLANAEVRNEVADSAMAEMLELIRKLREQPVSAADLTTAKDYLTGSFPLTIETPQQVAGQIASTLLLGRDVDYLEDYRERVAAVTAADVQRIAQRYIHPDRLRIVVVGDALALYDELAAFADRVTLEDAEGNAIAIDSLR